MTRSLSLRNRQRVRRVNTALLRRLTCWLLEEACHVTEYELGVHLVGATEMARVNWHFLQHKGSTDVITFDHAGAEFRVPGSGFRAGKRARGTRSGKPVTRLHGEVFICIDDAIAQAREFGTTWPDELARYVIHGVLHLLGHDDRDSASRRLMKREENRLLRESGRHFKLAQILAQKPKPKTQSAVRPLRAAP